MNQLLIDILGQYTKDIESMLARHEQELSRRLQDHRHRLTEIELAAVPALQAEVIGGMQRWMNHVIDTEGPQSADACDAQSLLRVLDRMATTLREKGKL